MYVNSHINVFHKVNPNIFHREETIDFVQLHKKTKTVKAKAKQIIDFSN